MTNSRLVIAALLFAIALAMLPTGGFSASELDREVTVSVVDHDEAYVGVDAYVRTESNVVGYTTDGEEITETERKTHVTVTNRFNQPITVTSIDGDPTLDRTPRLEPGDPYGWDLHECQDSSITVTVRGTGVFAKVTVDVDGNCQARPSRQRRPVRTPLP